MAQVHMTDAEVSGNFDAVLQKLGRGEEVVVDRNGLSVAIIRAAEQKPRTLTELMALAAERERQRGYAILLDEDYAAGVERIVAERKPWSPRSWE